MTDIIILEIIIGAMIAANAVVFGVLFGKVDFLMVENQMWLEDWIQRRRNEMKNEVELDGQDKANTEP